MKLAGRPVLTAFTAKHADARPWIQAWVREVEEATWATPRELKARYPSASLLPDSIVIFNVKGTTYRLESRVSFELGVVLVTWAGTHAEYSKRF